MMERAGVRVWYTVSYHGRISLGGLTILSHISIYLTGQSEDNYDNLGDRIKSIALLSHFRSPPINSAAYPEGLVE